MSAFFRAPFAAASEKQAAAVTSSTSSAPSLSSDPDRDDLIRLGKEPALKRNFSFWPIVGFTCTILITWEATLTNFTLGLTNGGPAGLLYGFIFCWIGSLSTFSALSELVSMAPTSGGQYHWVAMLAPKKSARILSYLTGWLTLAGWQGSVAAATFITGSLVQGMIQLCNPAYEGKGWQSTLLTFAVLAFAFTVNAAAASLLPKFEGLVLILHLAGFVAILVPLAALGTHSSAAVAFNTWNNEGNWSSRGLSFFVGLIGQVFAFSGVDGAFHLSEEIHNPRVVVPTSIVASVLLNGVLGFAMTIVTLFCLGELSASTTLFPFVDVFLQATSSVGGAAAMTAVIFVLAISACTGIMASTSRMFWALARDRGLPGWRVLSRVNGVTGGPLWAVGIVTLISALLSLIAIGSSVAFNDVISVSVSGLYSSYLICSALLLYRRVTGGIALAPTTDTAEALEAGAPDLVNTQGAQVVWGPWRIPGIWGTLNNTFSCMYLTIVLFFSFWPPATPVDAASFNWSVVATTGVCLLALVYYALSARHHWQGPVVEVRAA